MTGWPLDVFKTARPWLLMDATRRGKGKEEKTHLHTTSYIPIDSSLLYTTTTTVVHVCLRKKKRGGKSPTFALIIREMR